MIRDCYIFVECYNPPEMEKMRLSSCGVKIGDIIAPKIRKTVAIYSCPAIRLEPVTKYSVGNNNALREIDGWQVADFTYPDCWQIRDNGKCPAMQD